MQLDKLQIFCTIAVFIISVVVVSKFDNGEWQMTEVWKNLFKQNIKCYESIQILHEFGILDEEERAEREKILLLEIIDTMRAEVKG